MIELLQKLIWLIRESLLKIKTNNAFCALCFQKILITYCAHAISLMMFGESVLDDWFYNGGF